MIFSNILSVNHLSVAINNQGSPNLTIEFIDFSDNKNCSFLDSTSKYIQKDKK